MTFGIVVLLLIVLTANAAVFALQLIGLERLYRHNRLAILDLQRRLPRPKPPKPVPMGPIKRRAAPQFDADRWPSDDKPLDDSSRPLI